MSKGQRGRPQRELDTSVPALAELAQQLRELRRRAGRTLHDLSAAVNWSPASLSNATTGSHLPRWELVQAWVLACEPEANLALWHSRYDKAAQAFHLAHPARDDGGASATGQSAASPSVSSASGEQSVDRSPREPGTGRASPEPSASAAAPLHLNSTLPGSGSQGQSAAPVWQSALEQAAWRSLTPQSHARGLVTHPAPAPVRFTAVPADFMDQEEDARHLHGRYSDIAEIFALVPARRLLILGEPSSGKTQLARHLGEQLLASSRGLVAAALPVRFSLASWTPEQGLQHWMAGELNAMIDKERSRRRSRGLFHGELVNVMLGKRQLLPILDDFDRLSPVERGHALEALNRLPATAQFVVVSDYSEFASAVEQTDTVIAASAGIRLQPLHLNDLDGWLQRSSRSESRSRSKAKDWSAVITVLRARPDAPATRVLASPLLAGAARMLYTDGRADPRELISDDVSAQALEHRLVGYLVEQAAAGRQPSRPPDAPQRAPYRSAHASVLHFALERIALHELTRGRGVGALSDLYRPRPRSVLSAALQCAVLALCAYLYLTALTPKPDYGNPTYEETSALSGTAIAALFGTALLSWGYLGRESLWGTVPAYLQWVSSVRLFLAAIPGIVCLGLNLIAVAESSYATLDGKLFTLPFSGLIALSPLLTLWNTMPPDYRAFADGLFFLLTAVAALLALADSLPFTIIGLRFVLLTTTTGQWLSAAVSRPALLRDLSPARLLAALTRAAEVGLLDNSSEKYTLSHAEIARYYRSASWPRRPAPSPRPGVNHLWRRTG